MNKKKIIAICVIVSGIHQYLSYCLQAVRESLNEFGEIYSKLERVSKIYLIQCISYHVFKL